jgi:hypothetical protein
MENILTLIQCAMASTSFYSLGILLLHPNFILVKALEKKGYDYDYILNRGHKIVLCVWLISFIVITVLVFCYLN